MKIHTTQNLNSFAGTNSTNMLSSNGIRLNYLSKLRQSAQENDQQDTYEPGNVSFKGKREFIKGAKQAAENIKNTAGKENKWYDKVLSSGVFDKALDLMSAHEVFVQAAISAVICCALRPLTIMALPAKDKDDNKYASAHSISSGIVGVVASVLISVPFSKGIKYANKNLLKDLDKDILKKMFSHLKEESISKADGTRKPMEEWLDKSGNKFSVNVKDVMKAAKPRPIESVSEETLKELGQDVDIKAMAGKPVSEWVTRDGKKLNFRPQDMFVEIKEEGMEKGSEFFSLGLMNDKFLESTFKDLDIKSITKDGKRINPLEWKNKDGSQFSPDLLDNVYVSSWKETTEAIPLYSGETRIEKKGTKEVTKYCSYQTNIDNYDTAKVPDKLGTKITQEMLDLDGVNEVKKKLLGWMPDIITRPIVAASTIALIPAILSKVFHLEKHSKKQQSELQVQEQQPQVEEKAVA